MNIRRMGFVRACLSGGLALLLAACGGGGGGGGGPAAPTVSAPANVTAGGAGYVATVPAQSGWTYAWTINGGVITSGGQGATVVFTAGATGVVGLSVVATDAAGHASPAGTAQSTINAVPAITSFAVDTSAITAGQSTVLRWTTTGATTVTIDHGVGDVGTATSKTVSPTASTQYTLSATNPAGTTATATVAVAVDAVPVISSFTATPASISGGGSATLSAAFAGGSGVITPGNLAIVSGGSVSVSPAANQTYTLTVTNDAGGATTATTSVTLSSGFFTLGGTMVHPRSGHTATLLANGKVLIAGGSHAQTGGAVDVLEAELYDPATGSFQATGSLLQARTLHTATLLADGRVLIAGGGSAGAELYDPVTGQFTATGQMSSSRWRHTAVRLVNGNVLIAGGEAWASSTVSTTVEIYDPLAGSFTSALDPLGGGLGETAIGLNGGQVLVPGAMYNEDLGHFQVRASGIFDSSGSNAVATGAPPVATIFYLASRLADGRVLVAGGEISGFQDAFNAAVFDPATNGYTAVGSLLTGHHSERDAIVTLGDGRVLVLGATNELFDATSGTFSVTGALPIASSEFTATLLGDGTVLVVGGNSDSYTSVANAQIYH